MKILIILMGFLFSGCSCQVEVEPKADKSNERFTAEYIKAGYGTIIMITDTKTGTQYLSRPQGGFIKLDPTSNGISNAKIELGE